METENYSSKDISLNISFNYFSKRLEDDKYYYLCERLLEDLRIRIRDDEYGMWCDVCCNLPKYFDVSFKDIYKLLMFLKYRKRTVSVKGFRTILIQIILNFRDEFDLTQIECNKMYDIFYRVFCSPKYLENLDFNSKNPFIVESV